MSVDLVLKNGIVIKEGKETRASVAIKTGKIEGLYQVGDEPKTQDMLDCTGMYILPGAIDIHVHLRDLGQSFKEDYVSGTRAAAAGGVTTVVDMPNSQPPVLDITVLEQKIARARAGCYVNVGFYAGIPSEPEDFDTILVPDILGLKVYPHAPLDENTVVTPDWIKASLRIAAEHNLPLLFHPDSADSSFQEKNVEQFLSRHSCEAECSTISAFLAAQTEVGGKLHVCHVSCAAATRIISDHRAEDRLTAEVTPHHLFLSGDQFTHEDGTAKMLPPLRSPYDRETLRNSLSRCCIDVVASDHAPHSEEEKVRPFPKASSGIPGLETTIPLMLTEVFEGRLSWVEYLRVCCSGPARILSLSGKGVLSQGYDADISIIAREDWEIHGSDFESKAKRTPFEGRHVSARPVTTLVGGHIVYRDRKFVVGPGTVGAVPARTLVTPRNT